MLALTSLAVEARAELPSLIPREILFGNPQKLHPSLSPDGKRLAWIAPDQKNVLQVWVQTRGRADSRVVTADWKHGIHQYIWAEDNKTLLYLQDTDGDENWHLYGVDLASGRIRDFTPQPDISARLTAVEPNIPDEILVSLNVREKSLHDVYRLNLKSGALALDTLNPGDVAHFSADAKLQIRAAQAVTPDGGTEIRLREDVQSAWRTWIKADPGETLDFVSFTADGQSAILRSSLGCDKVRVLERNVSSGAEKVLAASEEVDVGWSILLHPRKRVVQAVAFEPDRQHRTVLDPSVKKDFEEIAMLYDGDFLVSSRDRADTTWLIAFWSDRRPACYYAWDRTMHQGTLLFVQKPHLEGRPLAAMQPIVLPSRDGLKLHGYLTLPVGIAAKKLPLVLAVHGGPDDRNTWGLDPEAQLFANRGYACLQINFRGSTGYGQQFFTSGNRQWGLKMHDDLIDAVNWAIKQGIANPKKVAICGRSYGGYAALAGVTFTPELFACAVDQYGPSNLRTLLESIPPYWKPLRAQYFLRMGNIDDPKDAALLRNASPLFMADRIVRPLLIGQGGKDVRVKPAESEQLVAAIEKHGGKVTYVLYSDEGHGFDRPENRIDFTARIEAFLGTYLGGRVEPIQGDRYPGSSAVVKVVGQ
jgi:dipeptidyl aminopeptidase/acylaminoacyl peptidase